MHDTLWLSCGVLSAEIGYLHNSNRITGKLKFLDSMLHMTPGTLEQKLDQQLDEILKTEKRTVLVYGDCCSGMHAYSHRKNVSRIDAINCAQMLLGKTRYRELMHEEAFFFLPEWLARWKEILNVELGLNEEQAKALMTDCRRILVYLDTGLAKIDSAEMQKCSSYTSLPWKIEKVDLAILNSQLLKAEEILIKRESQKDE